MKVAVAGLWHLGTVTAACLASAGHEVTGFDDDPALISGLQAARLPVAEPGLEELTAAAMKAGRLRFISDATAVRECNAVWITYDTPVDEHDRADVEFVLKRAAALIPHMAEEAIMVVSSQMPVGSIARLEQEARDMRPGANLRFACIPENLRLGKAIEVFTKPDRFVAGIRNAADRPRIAELLGPYGERVEWMSIESAEMTKHALNAFLATSIAFMNEIAGVCEKVGADALEVERGLKSEIRIGPRAYLHPGSAYAGGTLARDIAFLQQIGTRESLPVHLIHGVERSNAGHKNWIRHKLESTMGDIAGKAIAILGLTYKPGTDTLRRSSAVETGRWLASRGARVQAHDPAIRVLPDDLKQTIVLCGSEAEALRGTNAALVATEWPQFRSLTGDVVVAEMRQPLVFDPARFLQATLGGDDRILYYAIGKGDAAKR